MDGNVLTSDKIRVSWVILSTILLFIACTINALYDTPNERLWLAIAAKQEAKIHEALDAGASIEELIEVPAWVGDADLLHTLLNLSVELHTPVSLLAIDYALYTILCYKNLQCLHDLKVYKIWLESRLSYQEKLLVDAARRRKLHEVQEALANQTTMNEMVEYALIHSALWGELALVQCVVEWAEAHTFSFSEQVLKKAIFFSLRKHYLNPTKANYMRVVSYLHGKTEPSFDINSTGQEARDDIDNEHYCTPLFVLRSRL